MNYIDATVVEVGEIYKIDDEWAKDQLFLDVKYVAANNNPVKYTFMSKDRSELESIKPGYKFLV